MSFLGGGESGRRLTRLLLTATLVLLVVSAVLELDPFSGAGSLILFAGLAFMLLHASAVLGLRNALAFLVITVAVSFTAEAIGVSTSGVFGDYHYTDLLGPKVLGVPPLVQVAYVAMGYASMMAARLLIGLTGTPRGPWVFAGAAGSAVLMVSWDLAMDPHQSTLRGDWIWDDGGPYFGIPLHNYAGWFVTVFVFVLLYLLYERRRPIEASTTRAGRLSFAEPVVYYALIGLGLVIAPLSGDAPDELASPGGYAGTVNDLEVSTSLIALVAMGGPVLFAVLRACRPAGEEGWRPSRPPG